MNDLLKIFLCSLLISVTVTQDKVNSFSWDKLNGTNYLTYTRSLTTPSNCNANWAFVATSTISDRIKIKNNFTKVDIILSPQVLLTCAKEAGNCSSGNLTSAFDYILENGITEESCNNYRGLENLKCSNTTKCMDCSGHPTSCFLPLSFNVYRISSLKNFNSKEEIKEEIKSNGPLACYIPNSTEVAEIIGYFEYYGYNYYVAKNFKETYLFNNEEYLIPADDLNCFAPIIDNNNLIDPRINTTEEERKDNVNGQNNDVPLNLKNNDSAIYSLNEVKKSKREEKKALLSDLNDDLTEEELNEIPLNWDWRNVNNRSYVSLIKNQHIPIYCGSCWAQATSSALADRFIIKFNLTLPISLSAQYLVNCQPKGSSCEGGNSYNTYQFIKKNGIVDETCLQYIALNSNSPYCSPVQQCQRCDNTLGQCSPVESYKKYFIQRHGVISKSVKKMMREIYKNGPIACYIFSIDTFHKYKGGIYDSDSNIKDTNHVISLLGFGEENGVKYWIGRNSWGTQWGEDGFFRIKMGSNVLNIEHLCNYAIPKEIKTVNYDEPIKRHKDNLTFLEE